jgi:hypothetical protein
MKNRHITVLEDPMAYAGIEKGSDKVTLVFISDDGHEFHVMMGPLQATFAGQQLTMYGDHLLSQHVQVLERYESNITGQYVDRERPEKLDG